MNFLNNDDENIQSKENQNKKEIKRNLSKSLMASTLLLIGLTAYAGEAEKYHGEIFSNTNVSPDIKNFFEAGCVESEYLQSKEDTFCFMGGEITTSTSKKIKVIFLRRAVGEAKTTVEVYGRPVYPILWKIEDSIELSSKYGHLDTELCVSSEYPNAKIVCSGKWNWRKKPSGWGYMKPIKKAWRIDIENKKFVEIDTKSVKCELNEDRD